MLISIIKNIFNIDFFNIDFDELKTKEKEDFYLEIICDF